MRALAAALLLGLLLPAAPALACGGRAAVAYGETVAAVAARCGVNPEALRQANPGLDDVSIRAGTFLVVPRPPLPSPQVGYNRPHVRVQPPLTRPAPAGIGVGIAAPPIVHAPDGYRQQFPALPQPAPFVDLTVPPGHR